MLELASTYFQAADMSKAREYARQAVAAATGDSAALRQAIEQEAKRIAVGNK